MKTVLPLLLYLCSFLPKEKFSEGKIVAEGKQPEVSMDAKGTIRLVYGRNDSIFYSNINLKASGPMKQVYVAHVPGMHLGMTRGPQLSSSAHYSMITAMDKQGNIHWFLLDHKSGKRVKEGLVNDLEGSAPEGLMGLASDDQDNFYAVWLDLRRDKQNNIFFSSFAPAQSQWSANHLVYQSPEGHTCECCKPNIAVKGTHIAVMFRNWLNGSRDLYLAQSANGGKSFSPVQKLGEGTWKLKGCPMDGGGVSLDANNQAITVWQREGSIYMCKPGEKEVLVGKGRSCSVTASKGYVVCSYQDGNVVKAKELTSGKEIIVGKGSYLKTLVLPDRTLLCVWEEEGQVKVQKVEV